MNRIGLLLITIILVQFAVTIGVTVIIAASCGKTSFYGFSPKELYYAYYKMRMALSGNDYFMPALTFSTSSLEILTVWLFSKKVGVVNSSEVFNKPENWGADTALFGVVAFGASMIASLLVNLVKLILSGVKINAASPNFSIPTKNPAAAAIMIIALVVIGPFAEEYMCRGVILNVFKRFGSIFAIVGSALVWALLHGNIVQGIPVFAIGIFYGILALKTESVWPSFILHAINNLISVVGILLIAAIPKPLIPMIGMFNYMLIFMAIAFFSIFYKRFRFNTVHGSAYGFKTFFTSVSVIISIAACLGFTFLSFRPM